METSIDCAVELLRQAKHVTVFTGAGISVESGIPPFRGENGLWNQYDPRVLELEYFYAQPELSWKAIKAIFYDFFGKAKPNLAHEILARMERNGQIKSIITQNIDNLHFEAGSENVYEFHGNSQRLICRECGRIYKPEEINLDKAVPSCHTDGAMLKPDFVFFGEGIPEEAHTNSFSEADKADVFLIIGTTGEVVPASMIPKIAKQNGAKIIEINLEPSLYTIETTDVYLQGKACEIMSELDKRLRV